MAVGWYRKSKMDYLVVVIEPNGETRKIHQPVPPSAEQLRDLVGGWLEHVPFTGGSPSGVEAGEMYVDEDGSYKELPFNPMASLMTGQHVMGRAVVCYSFKHLQRRRDA